MPSITYTNSGSLHIRDPTENKQSDIFIGTDARITANDTPNPPFPFPTDSTAEIVTDSFSFTEDSTIFVRDDSGNLTTVVDPGETITLSAGTYILELALPMTTYLKVTLDSATIQPSSSGMEVSFNSPQPVIVGVQAIGQTPRETITLPSDSPTHLARALSFFGHGLSTLSPERSYPTYRSPPPEIQVDEDIDEPQIPDSIVSAYDSTRAITLYINSAYTQVLPITSLAYYLNADVVITSGSPRLKTATGYEYTFNKSNFAKQVADVFQHIFVLDCVVRAEGNTPVSLDISSEIIPQLDFSVDKDFFEKSLSEHIEAYLDTPLSVTEPHTPKWGMTATIDPSHTGSLAGVLPYLADSLALTETLAGPTVELARGGTVDNTWYGSGCPAAMQKLSAAGIQNTYYSEKSSENLDIHVVCNERSMVREAAAIQSEYAGETTVTYHSSTDELADIFTSGADFVYYIGHCTSDALKCSDGDLDLDSVPGLDVEAFFLNGCQSFTQGEHLIEAGAAGGIVTQKPVVNDSAITVGRDVSLLLTHGYSLTSAIEIAMTIDRSAFTYTIIGNPHWAVTQADGALQPLFCTVDAIGPDTFEVEISSYSATNNRMGSITRLRGVGDSTFSLTYGHLGSHTVSTEELQQILSKNPIQVLCVDGELKRVTEESEMLNSNRSSASFPFDQSRVSRVKFAKETLRYYLAAL